MLNQENKSEATLEESSYFFPFDYEVYEISFAEERIGAERPVDRIHLSKYKFGVR